MGQDINGEDRKEQDRMRKKGTGYDKFGKGKKG